MYLSLTYVHGKPFQVWTLFRRVFAEPTLPACKQANAAGVASWEHLELFLNLAHGNYWDLERG